MRKSPDGIAPNKPILSRINQGSGAGGTIVQRAFVWRRHMRGHYIASNDCLEGNRYEVLAHFHCISSASIEKILTTGIDK